MVFTAGLPHNGAESCTPLRLPSAAKPPIKHQGPAFLSAPGGNKKRGWAFAEGVKNTFCGPFFWSSSGPDNRRTATHCFSGTHFRHGTDSNIGQAWIRYAAATQDAAAIRNHPPPKPICARALTAFSPRLYISPPSPCNVSPNDA